MRVSPARMSVATDLTGWGPPTRGGDRPGAPGGPPGRSRVGDVAGPGPASLEALLARWQHVVWWTTLQPVGQRMLDLDLTLPELITLRRLEQAAMTVTDVATNLNITPSAASRTVDRLVGAGFLARRENPADRRQKQLTLTDEGLALIREIEGLVTDRLRPLLARLDRDELAALHRLLAVLLAPE